MPDFALEHVDLTNRVAPRSIRSVDDYRLAPGTCRSP
jgi:hypothetical protein